MYFCNAVFYGVCKVFLFGTRFVVIVKICIYFFNENYYWKVFIDSFISSKDCIGENFVSYDKYFLKSFYNFNDESCLTVSVVTVMVG